MNQYQIKLHIFLKLCENKITKFIFLEPNPGEYNFSRQRRGDQGILESASPAVR